MTIAAQRIQRLNNRALADGQYVLYWMQASQRIHNNHALNHAIKTANAAGLPLLVVFCLISDFPAATSRHYTFMLEGLQELAAAFPDLGISFYVIKGSPAAHIPNLSRQARTVVTDRGYLRIQRHWREEVARLIMVPLIQVESDVVVPIQTVSNKEEWSAATLRRKIHMLWEQFLVPVDLPEIVNRSEIGIDAPTVELSDLKPVLKDLKVERIPTREVWIGGESAGAQRLNHFIQENLSRYAIERNDPNAQVLSDLSPYLHFGQISPIEIACTVRSTGETEAADVFCEELIVRRELSMNFVFYNPLYDDFAGLPAWAQETLNRHRFDTRSFVYDRDTLELAETHDPYWNAAQREMIIAGKMHGYMRMYWGKKILEWSISPEEAFQTALYLNNKYELDGRDPNGYAGVAWGFGKHDRPWGEREIFGMVRYMNANGLKRKFDADAYVRRIAGLGGIGKLINRPLN
ncbi:MAG: deoxyribodipyrimidine photo-lyase [Candidatus Marinimicrobia bacterium]|nr:deoxyribodipyrimidine photo-lyase [Candidatus Neomarinimicrobiota bacterium]